jgi:hypothetical protein
MSDASYGTKVYLKQGGDEQVIKSGGYLRNQGYDIAAQPAPTAKTVAVTLTIAELLTKIIAAVPTATGATAAYTLPTGALIDAGLMMEVDDSFDWCLINSALAAADTITVTSPGADHTIVGNPIVQSLHVSTGGVMGYSSMWRTRKTAAATYISYRIA